MARQLLADADGVAAAIARLADAIAEEMRAGVPGHPGAPWAIVGVRRGGVELADRLATQLTARGLPRPSRGNVDITLYRDDLYTGLEKPELGETTLPFEVAGTAIVLVDDVLFTGRTVRAALGEIHDFGRPAVVRLAALVDRGHRELPIAADFVGLVVPTAQRSRVVVDLAPGGAAPTDRVWVEDRP